MTLRLVPPNLAGLPQYAAALEAGWSPSTTHDVSATQLAALQENATAFLTELTRQDGTVVLANGKTAPRLPGRLFWLDDGEFCGSINFRFWRGSEELPPYVHGHIGYTVVPWKRRRGYATRALALMLPVAREAGLTRLQITCDDDNEPSRRVIVANGGVFEHGYPADGKTKLLFWIDL